MFVLLVSLLACGSGDQPGGGSARPVDHFPTLTGPSGATNLQLDRLEAKLVLGAPELQAPTGPADEFVLEHEEVPNPTGQSRKLMVLRAPMPFPVSAEEQRFAPVGMRVFVEGVEIPFSRGKAAVATESNWRVSGKHLVVAHPTIPPAGAIRVVYPGVQTKLDRHDPERSGLSPQEFTAYDLSFGTHTRRGMMLPAPSAATWTVDLPAVGPRFEGYLAMEPAPLSKPRSDGAIAVLSVVVDGKTTEVARQKVEAETSEFSHWLVDLSAYAGKRVDLVLETRPIKNNHFDWVFVGSPSVWGEPSAEVRRVVVLAMDTTRPDHFGHNGYDRGTTPNMDRIASQSVTFDRTWSTAPRTRPSFRTATTGRLPLQAVGAKNIGAVFEEQGFATAGIVANVHLQPRFDFNDGFDTWSFDGRADAKEQVDRGLAWLKENEDRDSYLFLHFMDPHLPYKPPQDLAAKYVTAPDPSLPDRFNRWEVNKWSKRGKVTDVRKEHIEGLYDGELAFMDQQIGRFFDELDKLPGKTLVVVHTDHGEEFWEHGGYEHNHTLYDEVTRTVLWFRPGGGLTEGRRVDTPASLMDIGPTLYELIGQQDPPVTDGRSLAPFLRGEQPEWPERPLALGYLQYDHERWGVVWQGHKYILHTGTGQEELYDLAADPKESKDLAATKELQPWRDAMSKAHDVPVRPGWRLFVDLRDAAREPLTVTFPRPVVAADVLDPECTVEHRANLEWGEPPSRTPAEVGAVTLSEDKTTLTFTPGEDPEGILWVQFDAPTPVDGVGLALGGAALDVEVEEGRAAWGTDKQSVRVEAGQVLVPPPGEYERMMALHGDQGADPEAMQMLKDLGYMQ